MKNRSKFKHKISIPVLAEISNVKPEKLRKIYHQIIEYDCIPLSEIPLIHQEQYIYDYYLQTQTLDLDLMKIAEHPDFETDFPFLFSREVQQFFKTTKMIREANRISDSYASCKTVTSKLEELAARYGISYRTLVRRRNYFMNQNILLKLLEDPSDHEDNKPIKSFSIYSAFNHSGYKILFSIYNHDVTTQLQGIELHKKRAPMLQLHKSSKKMPAGS